MAERGSGGSGCESRVQAAGRASLGGGSSIGTSRFPPEIRERAYAEIDKALGHRRQVSLRVDH